MSEEQDTSAFPLHMHGDYGRGITIRDYFAAAALQGWLASWPEQGTPHPAANDNASAVAKLTYDMADAMIEARKEGA